MLKKSFYISALYAMMLFASHTVLADSPLTSTTIYLGYKNEPIVVEALEYKVLSKNILEYLESSQNPVAIKIAVINALGWNIDGNTNAERFLQYLYKKNEYENTDVFLMELTGEMIICLAYFVALGDYFDVDNAVLLANHAKAKSPRSYTVNIICALIEAQKAFNDDWCEVYNLVNRVRENDTLIDDMNEEAKAAIFEYMDLYECSLEEVFYQ